MRVLKTSFVLDVVDMQRASRFYVRALGLTVTFESNEWTELDSGGVPVALRAGREPGPVETGLSFEVDDIVKACAMLREMGATIVEAPRQLPDVDLRIARVADPEGNGFSVVETG